ncbi:Glutathione transport system permease protein gsiC [Raoultella terrigena]|uniref:Glutathione transport system permease protein gsiC n=1 Tax=Raoultella terrigena TaxID=577 RepID=A0A3P8LYM5_RAOTE|nr:Glutathione transport system permease protein gsiC [Raoultella terrigena]
MLSWYPATRSPTRWPASSPAEAIEQIRHVYGLDKPAAVQYLLWLKNLFSGDWGTSLTLRAPVVEVLSSAFANTAILTGAAVLMCLIPGVAVGRSVRPVAEHPP